VTRDTRLDADLRSWLHADQHEDGERVLFVALERLDETQQRRRSWLARRFPIMNSNRVRFGIAAAAVVVLALLGWRLVPDTNVANPSPASASPSPSPSPHAIPLGRGAVDTILPGGRYSLTVGEGAHQFGIDLDVPAGWVPQYVRPDWVSINNARQDYSPQINFLSVRRVYADPCHPEDGVAGSHKGPSTADQLVAELRALKGFNIGDLSTTSVGGMTARHFIFEWNKATAAGCTEDPWLPFLISWEGTVSSELAHRNLDYSISTVADGPVHVWIITRDNDPNALVMVSDPVSADRAQTPADMTTIEQIMASIRFY
jgi:hypothetical protein